MKLKINENQVNLILEEIIRENEMSSKRNSIKEMILSVATLTNIPLSGMNKRIGEDSLKNDDLIERLSGILSDKRILTLVGKMESFGIKDVYTKIINKKSGIEYFINTRLKEIGKEKNFKIYIELE